MMNYSKMLFMVVMGLGTMMAISANSWLSAWMGLEINLLAFIPLMSDSNNLMTTESSLKYFLTQALASSALIFSMILMMLKFSYTFMIQDYSYANGMLLSTLLLKSGAAPLHWWFPNVMEGLSWMNNVILMTWQKIAPLMMISYIMIKPLLIISIILSTMIGAIMGLNQTSLRKLMAYSSINHLGWMMAAMMATEMLWMIYFMFYSLMSFSVILIFNIFKMFHINQIFTQFFNSTIMKFMIFMNLLSMGGLPPFMGFIPKWLVIEQMTIMMQYSMTFVMMMMTLIVLYYYLRLCYSAFMMNHNEMNLNINYNQLYSLNMLIAITSTSLMGMTMMSILYYML